LHSLDQSWVVDDDAMNCDGGGGAMNCFDPQFDWILIKGG